jgi:hypothetical protein
MKPLRRTSRKFRATATFMGLAVAGGLGIALPSASVSATPGAGSGKLISSAGLAQGSIKHVWLIILENKSYDETFTGLNQNSYLWQTLPSQGALLTNYYGTGHFSMDNYISLVSGQSPQYDTQADCSTTAGMVNNDSGLISTGSVGNRTDTDLTSSGHGKYTNAPTTAGAANGNYGQILTHGGVDASLGSNGCVYPDQVPTLFNQFNAAGVAWKGYAQDLGGAQPTGATSYQTDSVPGRDDGTCGYPGTSAANAVTNPSNLVAPGSNPTGNVASYTGAQAANTAKGLPADQYVAKHFPFPWFTSLSGQSAGTQNGVTYPAAAALNQPKSDLPGETVSGQSPSNCDPSHIANLDDPSYGLVHDLQSEATTPAFSWITPNNCSDAHDATCQGNNLSGSFDASGQPVYNPGGGVPAYDPEATTPTNFTGGLYASDLFLRYYIPLIEASPAFKDGGLIDITFDEANPPFTIGNSFNNANTPTEYGFYTDNGVKIPNAPTFGTPSSSAPGADSQFGAYGLAADAAGENLFGHNVGTEPTGPNDPEVTNPIGDQLQPGPGASGFIDRPTGLPNESPDLSGSPGAATEPASYSPASSTIVDPKINADDTGRLVSGPGIPPDSFVGSVSNTGPVFLSSNASTSSGPAGANNNFAKPWTGSFTLVNDSGQPVTPSMTETNASPGGSGSSDITLSAEGANSTTGTSACPTGSEAATTGGCTTLDPLYDASDFTPGGGDTGSVLISPYIRPGTVSSVYYNHYSWLRTMEDLFLTGAHCVGPQLTVGSVCGGLDGAAHIGYAAQPGLASFGPDVFTNPHGHEGPHWTGGTSQYGRQSD